MKFQSNKIKPLIALFSSALILVPLFFMVAIEKDGTTLMFNDLVNYNSLVSPWLVFKASTYELDIEYLMQFGWQIQHVMQFIAVPIVIITAYLILFNSIGKRIFFFGSRVLTSLLSVCLNGLHCWLRWDVDRIVVENAIYY